METQEDYKKKFLECNDKFETIFNLTSAPSKVINSDLTILRVNKAITELLGFSAEEIEGTKILDYACKEYKEHWHHLQDASWSKKMPFFKLDACLIKKDKSLVWVNVTTVLFNDNDETFGFTIFENVTYLKHFEESEKRLNMALQYSKMAVWEMDLNNYSVVRSQSHDELFGYEKPLEKWNKETYLQHLLPEDSAAFEEVMRSLKNERILDYRGRIQAVNKVVKWVYFQGRVETNAQGKPVKVLGTINDITKEKIAERHKDEFITTVSHELKTPITSIKAQTQVLERRLLKAVDADTANMFRRINLQISRLNTIIKDLLEVGQLEEQKLPFRNEGYLFNEMVEETVADIQRTTATHQILIENNRPTSFIGDRERTSQVVSNLLTNAIKYSPGKDKVIVRIEEHQDQVFCSIQDFGIGISPEKQADIFKRFYRATGSSDYGHVFSGFGLGLYISSEIIKGLGGKIWVKAEVGEGSTFYFSLPKTA